MNLSQQEPIGLAIINKIGIHQAQRLLQGEMEIVESEAHHFPIWKTVETGSGPLDHKSICQNLQMNMVKTNRWSEDVLAKVHFSRKKSVIGLVQVSFRQLGIRRKRATLASIIDHAKNHGLYICPDETAVHLWIQHSDLLTRGQSVFVITQPIVDSIRVGNIFSLDHLSDGKWLHVNHARPNSLFCDFQSLVFARRP